MVLELREKGVIDYKIRVTGVKDEVTSIRIEGSATKNHRRRVIGNVHKTFVKDFGSFSGWVCIFIIIIIIIITIIISTISKFRR